MSFPQGSLAGNAFTVRTRFIFISLLALSTYSLGEAEKEDFSNGLEQLAKLGLPSMKGAEWVKSPIKSHESFTKSYEFREMGVSLSGSAWKLATDPPTYIEFGSAETLDPPEPEPTPDATSDPEEKPGFLGKMLRGYQEKNPEARKTPQPKAQPQPKISKAAKDAEKITAALAKSSVAEELNNNIDWGSSDLHSRLMLFAAQLHAAGDTQSANKLAAALFNTVTQDTALIDGAISYLADSTYTATAESFFETTDWDTYLAECTALLEKFPRGWANAPAVALLTSKLQNRTAPKPTPSLPGITLNPQAIQLLDALLEKTETPTDINALAAAQGININDYPPQARKEIIAMLRQGDLSGSHQQHGIWLLPDEENPQDPASSPIEKLKNLRMDALIALAAITQDHTLIPSRHSSSSSSYFSRSSSPAEQLQERYQSLARPTTRGEIAISLLTAIIPAPEHDPFSSSGEIDPTTLTHEAIAFWKSHKDKTPVQLATLYITEGSSTQQAQATSFLTSSTDPAAHTAFEKAVLASPDPISLAENVEAYLVLRKRAAKPFATAYIALLRENPPTEEDLESTPGGYHIRDAGGVENFIKKLSLKIGDVSLEKMIAQALKAPAEPHPSDQHEPTPLAALHTAIESITLEECLLAFGKAAPLASTDQWMEIHQLLLARIYRELENAQQPPPNSTPHHSPAIIQTWKPLLAKTDPLPTDGQFAKYARAYGGETTGDGSAIILELAADPQLAYTFGKYLQIEPAPTALMETIRTRLEASLSGRTPQPWPNPENVSEERSAEISAKLTSLPASEILPYAQSLSRDERLLLMDLITTFNDANPPPPGLLELRSTIVSLQPYAPSDHDQQAAAQLGISVGEKITPELIDSISDRFLLDPATHSTTNLVFYPSAMNLGVTLYLTTAKDLHPEKLHSTRISHLARTMARLELGDSPAFCAQHIGRATDNKLLKNGKPTTLESEDSAIQVLKDALKANTAILPPIRISTLSQADFEKISNQE